MEVSVTNFADTNVYLSKPKGGYLFKIIQSARSLQTYYNDMTASKSSKASTGQPVSKQNLLGWFSIPGPVRRAFDHFPLQTYNAVKLPQRSPRHRNQHVLYLFTSESTGELSCNPACLKWQVWNPLFCQGLAHLPNRRTLGSTVSTLSPHRPTIMHPPMARCHLFSPPYKYQTDRHRPSLPTRSRNGSPPREVEKID